MDIEAKKLLLQLFWARQVFKEPDLLDLFRKLLQNFECKKYSIPYERYPNQAYSVFLKLVELIETIII
mgnify:CR=1 FL=1